MQKKKCVQLELYVDHVQRNAQKIYQIKWINDLICNSKNELVSQTRANFFFIWCASILAHCNNAWKWRRQIEHKRRCDFFGKAALQGKQQVKKSNHVIVERGAVYGDCSSIIHFIFCDNFCNTAIRSFHHNANEYNA